MTPEQTTPHPTRPAGPGRTTGESVRAAVPSVGVPGRIRAIAGQQIKEMTVAGLSRLPGMRTRLDRPRTQPLRSSSLRMFRSWQAPYGTAGRPGSLEEIPWDYIEENQNSIPFLGLREYWYPALESSELRHNEAKPVTLLGDNLVFFRSADGQAQALENRCPHRSVLLSLGPVGVVEPGTITCRYHGMTFDGSGECVAYIADGPNSAAVGKIRARSYAVEEHGGIIWAYMGDREPLPFLDSQPHARTILGQDDTLIQKMILPYSHLNMLDNATDLTHVGVLHRSCLFFAGQKPFGEIGYTETADGGLHAFYKEPGEHPGQFNIDRIDWYLPNVVYHPPGDVEAVMEERWFWFAPRDVGSFTAWMIVGRKLPRGRVRRTVARWGTKTVVSGLFGQRLSPAILVSCLLGGDAPMQASQGRVVRWDQERLTRGDRTVSRARRMITQAHRAEVAER